MTNLTRWITLIALLFGLAACSPKPTKTVPEEFKKGQRLFHQICANCHNADAMGGLTKAPKLIDEEFLASNFSDDDIRDTVVNGSQSGKMPSQRRKIDDDGITEVIKYLRYSQEAAGIEIIEEEEAGTFEEETKPTPKRT